MARGIKFTDTIYEIDNGTATSNGTAVIASMLLRMDAFNLGTAKTKLTKSTITEPLIAAHVKGDLNKNEYGVQPRYIELELELGNSSASCFGGTQKRRVSLIVPTLTQFNSLKVYDKVKGGTQADTTIAVNHSFDGKNASTYKITRKVAQRLV